MIICNLKPKSITKDSSLLLKYQIYVPYSSIFPQFLQKSLKTEGKTSKIKLKKPSNSSKIPSKLKQKLYNPKKVVP